MPGPTDPGRKFQNRTALHVVLFVLTLATTTGVGALHYHSFVSEFGRIEVHLRWGLLIPGLWYSLTILGILGAHEMGHYAYCRRYNVNATLPFFLPLPPWPFFTGTLGAVIKIREPFPTRTALFDIGVAGPIAGFAVLVPALFIGLTMSTIVPVPTGENVLLLGEPLLFRGAVSLMFGSLPANMTLNMHPMVFASWFGMLATALNLLPFGQLDGGHITYATLKKYSTPLSLATVTTAVVMTWVSASWMFLAVMMLLMLFLLGPRHPRVVYEWEPLSRGRYVVALIAVIILVLCFTPVPITPFAS
jgi:membrane-associated protease RseP (regulator of RpoE activity)